MANVEGSTGAISPLFPGRSIGLHAWNSRETQGFWAFADCTRRIDYTQSSGNVSYLHMRRRYFHAQKQVLHRTPLYAYGIHTLCIIQINACTLTYRNTSWSIKQNGMDQSYICNSYEASTKTIFVVETQFNILTPQWTWHNVIMLLE